MTARWLTLFALTTTPPALAAAPARTDLVLITVDTIRADALAPWGGPVGLAPTIERLAHDGVVVERAIAPAPLTLPAHASLLTGLDPPQHGLRDNGVGALPADVATLAETLARAGYWTAAAVGSRVLDRRFGLDRGFDHYDDGAPAERLGQFGYPERDAIATTDAALELLRSKPKDAPLFLWVHYYDPHAPYQPADGSGSADERASWLREIAVVDREVGRLLAALPQRPRVVAVVGDHGEAFGEHGETGHGLLLHEAVLRVPLVLAGTGVPPGIEVPGTHGTVHLANTLLATLKLPLLASGAPPMPLRTEAADPRPVLSETWLPWSAWGWSPLQAVTEGPWRLVVGPTPRLFDLSTDPREGDNRIDQQRRIARRLEDARRRLDDPQTRRQAQPSTDPETAAALRSLGYVGAGSGRVPSHDLLALARSGLPDPWLGPARLEQHEKAKRLLGEGAVDQALAILDTLLKDSPDSVPFLSTRASAHEGRGNHAGALADLDRAIRHAPALDFLALSRGDLLARMGRTKDAEAEWTRALSLNPRLTGAWLGLAETAAHSGDGRRERELLEQGVAAGCQSAALHLRLAQLDLAAKQAPAALRHTREATTIAPGWALAWRLQADAARAVGDAAEATRSLERWRRLGGG
jgi:arylsulfatase A-like enzyme/Flp pilus assembly protein TadD